MTDLGTLGGSIDAAVINNRGQAVGTSRLPDGQSRAFLWEDGTLTDLGTLGGNYSSANSINDRGRIIGGSNTTSTPGKAYLHAFVWKNGKMVDFGTGRGFYSVGLGISDSALLWEKGLSLEQLSTGVSSTSAVGQSNYQRCMASGLPPSMSTAGE